MKFSLWSIGKAHEPYVKSGVDHFTERLTRYYPAAWTLLPAPKNAATLAPADLRKREAEMILHELKPGDYLVALDENGLSLTSDGLARFLQQRLNESIRNIVFLIGGAYGLHESVRQKAKTVWSLSALTFPHQLVRLILAEQLYRACTILRNEKYHHP